MLVLCAAYAASGGRLTASEAVYQAEGDSASLTVEGNVAFDHSGYHFTAEKAEVDLDRPEDESIDTNLKRAVFSGGVSVTTPTGGRLTSPAINVARSGETYNFTGAMTYVEGALRVTCGNIGFNGKAETFTATGNVEAVYTSERGLKGDDGREHPVVYKSSGLVYRGSRGIISNLSDAPTQIEFDGLIFTSSDIELTLADSSLARVAASGDISVSGKGITLSGVNAEYDASSGALRVWGDVKYKRGGDELSAEEVTWDVSGDDNRVSVKGGSATVDVGKDNDNRDGAAEG